MVNHESDVISRVAKGLNLKSDYANEIFLYFLLPIIEEEILERGLKDDFEILGKIKEKNPSRLFLFISLFFLIPASILVGFFIALILTIRSFFLPRPVKCHNSLVLVRSPASLSKLKNQKLFLNSDVLFDDVFFKKTGCQTLYSLDVLLSYRFFFQLLHALVFDVKSLVEDVSVIQSRLLSCRVLRFYGFRLIFKSVYQVALDRHLGNDQYNVLITGEKEDRYAMAQAKICSSRGVEVYCIPHGLEYGFSMPVSVNFDRFYCLTEKSMKVLTRVGDENTIYLYDNDVANNMLCRSFSNNVEHQSTRLVFFPESRGLEVNRTIISLLLREKLDFRIKLHPLDCRDNYLDLVENDFFIEDLDAALTGNVCLARRSTILLEAGFNSSIACSIIINDSDSMYVESIFPSLSSSSIKKFSCVKQLTVFLKDNNFV
ncbi:hypothetical protein ACUALS_00930 [Vibrio sp. NH-7]